MQAVSAANRRLRVGFDGRALTSIAAGVRRYTRLLFGALAQLPEAPEIVAVGATSTDVVPSGVLSSAGARTLPTNVGWMAVGLPKSAKRAHVDVFHAPSYTAPLNGPRPLVLTIHDVSYARHPEWYPHRRDPVRRAFYKWSARTADVVVTDSAFSKQEIIAAYDLPEEVIAVIPLAAAPWFTDGPALPLPAGIRAPYLLHVGDLHPRRNLRLIAELLRRLLARRVLPPDLTLVCVGVDRGSAREVAEALPAATRLVGAVSDDALLALYRSAAAFVYPSRYEGFGIPLVEAMACGAPVVASSAASIPEVVGDAGMLVDPDDAEGWAAAIARVILDEAHRAELKARGLHRAREFSWTLAAERTRTVYEQAVQRR